MVGGAKATARPSPIILHRALVGGWDHHVAAGRRAGEGEDDADAMTEPVAACGALYLSPRSTFLPPKQPERTLSSPLWK
jgi:hypothetical protein